MSTYQDDPSKYQTDNIVLAQAMAKARHAEDRANQAKVEALAEAAKEEAFQQEIARATELSVKHNPQLVAQRMGIMTSRVTRSQDVGMIAPPEVVSDTSVKFNGIDISAQAAKNMVECGQWDNASYQKARAWRWLKAASRLRGLFRNRGVREQPSFCSRRAGR